METNLMSNFDWRRSTGVRIAVCVAAALAVLVAVSRSGGGSDEAASASPSTTIAAPEAEPPAATPEDPGESAGAPAAGSDASSRDGSIMDQLAERFGFDRDDGHASSAQGGGEAGRAATADSGEQVTPDWVDARYAFSVLRPEGWSVEPAHVPDSVQLAAPSEDAIVTVAGAALTDGGLEAEIEFFRAEADGTFDDYREDTAGPAQVAGMDGYVITGTFSLHGRPGVFEVRLAVDGDSLWKTTILIDGTTASDAVVDQAAAVADSVTVTRTS